MSAASGTSAPIRVLALTNSFPSVREPDQGPFMLRRMAAVRDAGCELPAIVVPLPRVPWPASMLPRYRKMARTAAAPCDETYEGFRLVHPKFWKLPGWLDRGSFGTLYWRGLRETALALHREHRFELVHGHSLVPDGVAAARLGQELGIPAVATERGYANRCPARGRTRQVYRETIASLDAVAAVSGALAAKVTELGAPRRPVEVIYTGADTECFAPMEQSAARRKLSLPEGPLVACFARMEAIKSPQVLMQAFAQISAKQSGARLAWIGDGEARPVLEAAARGAKLLDRLLLPGRVAHAEVPTWMAAADVVVLASQSEGLPNSLVEAASCGKPIVATNVGGVPEVVIDGRTGLLVPEGQPTALAYALGQLLADPELRSRMGEAGRRHALEHFSWRRHGEATIALYRSVLKQ